MKTTSEPFQGDEVRTTSVVICAYTERRWDSLTAAVASLQNQHQPPEQIVLVIDHNPALLERARSFFTTAVEVVANAERQGLSGARNTGLRYVRADVVAFLDDDAEADPRWLEELVAHYGPDIAGTGGVALAAWPGRGRPPWFPHEFDWVVGCSYVGLPEVVAPQRNLVGASMSFRRSVFEVAGTFDTGMGRVGSVPLGCEETEFSIRLRRTLKGSQLLHVPSAVVHHRVSHERTRAGYFVRRCYAEGISKALVSQLAGTEQALSSERIYVRSTLPRGLLQGVRSGVRGDRWGFARAAMICVGLLITVAGFFAGRVRREAALTTNEQHCAPEADDSPDGLGYDARGPES